MNTEVSNLYYPDNFWAFTFRHCTFDNCDLNDGMIIWQNDCDVLWRSSAVVIILIQRDL